MDGVLTGNPTQNMEESFKAMVDAGVRPGVEVCTAMLTAYAASSQWEAVVCADQTICCSLMLYNIRDWL